MKPARAFWLLGALLCLAVAQEQDEGARRKGSLCAALRHAPPARMKLLWTQPLRLLQATRTAANACLSTPPCLTTCMWLRKDRLFIVICVSFVYGVVVRTADAIHPTAHLKISACLWCIAAATEQPLRPAGSALLQPNAPARIHACGLAPPPSTPRALYGEAPLQPFGATA